MMFVLWLWGCAPLSDTPPVQLASTTDTATPADSGDATGDPSQDTDPAEDDGFRGQLLDTPLQPPDFLVLNQAEETRTSDWLLLAPTVLWFYRDASLAG